MPTPSSSRALIARLAEHICGFPRDAITPEAIALAKLAITDTVGVTLAGMAEPAVTLMLQVPGVARAPGKATVFGPGIQTSALDAALANGTGSHALDYDDFSEPMGGHQSVPLVAPLIALAEERGASGRAVIDAYVVGIETELKLARALNFVHYEKGWHPTSTIGTFGAAAACGHLIGLTAPQMGMALALAASMASGIKANFGTMTKPLHVGHCGRQGLFCALLAERGYTANIEALEHGQGFLNVYNGPGQFDVQAMLAAWAAPLEVLGEDMGLKQFPCCGSTHPAIMLALRMQRERDLPLDRIEKVRVAVHRRRLPHTDNPDPRTPLQAKFSVQYAVARALVDRRVGLAHFEGDAPFEPAIRAAMSLIEVRPFSDTEAADLGPFGASLRVRLKDGSSVSGRLRNTVGRGRLNPMSNEEMWEKFKDCAQRSIPLENAERAFLQLARLEEISDIKALTGLLAAGAEPARQGSAGRVAG